ncbi:MAG: heterodisulfide reductase-related iron-sulfur binding cluster [Deltaproteobacteria bacterium]|nr:heterodisulfide reductase-related iron-sulfur binding cluster [Deltaproteobacteria bacterium]
MFKQGLDPKSIYEFKIKDINFLDEKDLFNEIRRVYSKCISCRICIGFCPSFPALFNAFDNKDGDMNALTDNELTNPLDLCFYCKQCYFKCPFTPPHEWRIDFPHLALRYKVFRFKKEGAKIQDRLLLDTDKMGKRSVPLSPVINKLNNFPLFRSLLEPIMGIDKRAKVPSFNKVTFEKWFYDNYKKTSSSLGFNDVSNPNIVKTISGSYDKIDNEINNEINLKIDNNDKGNNSVNANNNNISNNNANNNISNNNTNNSAKAVLFYTCMINYNFLDRGIALIKVLEKNGINIELPDVQCCGIPYYDIGDIESSIQKAKFNVKSLKRYVNEGYNIIVPVPTCAMQIKHEYPLLLPDDDDVIAVANKTYDVHEYLFHLYENGKFNMDFKKPMGKIVYHISCHLKSLNIGYRALSLLKLIPQTEITVIEKCSGHDGTFGVKKKTFDYAVNVGKNLFEDINSTDVNYYVSDCPLASDQIEMGTGKKVMHPLEILYKSYMG